MKGTVKWFNDKKGFGFLKGDDGKEVFVHFSAIQSEDGKRKTLQNDAVVTYDIVEGRKGEQADNVVVVSATEAKDE